MGVTDISTDINKYVCRKKGGKRLFEKHPIFSPDGTSIIIISANSLYVYNIKIAECVRTLETEDDQSHLVDVEFPTDEDYNLYGCTDNCCLIIWTWETGAVMRKKSLSIPEGHSVLTFNLLNSNECFITSKSTTDKLHIGTYSTKTGNIINEFAFEKLSFTKIWNVAIGIYKKGKFAVICNCTAFVFLCDIDNPHRTQRLHNTNYINVISLATHPSISSFVTGDALGRAIVWKGDLLGPKNAIITEVLHWHTLPLIALTFSIQGSYLLTGGMERVLVKWSRTSVDMKENEKQFLPRLPGEIKYIATNNVHIVIATTNNSIQIVTPQLNLVSTILECGGLSDAGKAHRLGFMYHQPTASLILGGRTGHLQLFSTLSDKLLYNIDITGLNKIPPSRLKLKPTDVEVSRAATSADGSWLVTSEYRNDGNFSTEEKLKFWSATHGAATMLALPFTLNTCVNLSHSGSQVTCIALNSTAQSCVTAGMDQKFRVWIRAVDSFNKNISWSCLTACYYSLGMGLDVLPVLAKRVQLENCYDEEGREIGLDYLRKPQVTLNQISCLNNEIEMEGPNVAILRLKEAQSNNTEMGGVAISVDGSLIAAWFGHKLTLWDTSTYSLKTTLSHPSLRPKGVDVQFGSKDVAHYLACTTEHCLAVWHLLSLSLKWLVNISPTVLTADYFSNRMAVVTSNNDVFVFTPHSSRPILSKRKVMDPKLGLISNSVFVSSRSDNDIRLYLMRNDCEIFCLEQEGKREYEKLEVPRKASTFTSKFSAFVAEKQVTDISRNALIMGNVITTDKPAALEFFSNAAHTLPPVSMLCTQFLESLNGWQNREETEDADDEIAVEGDDKTTDDEQDFHGKLVAKFNESKVAVSYNPNEDKMLQKIFKERFRIAALDV